MKPVVLIDRTPNGDAYRYRRYVNRECTDFFKFDPVPVGKPLAALGWHEVEQLRTRPESMVKT